MMDAPPTIRTRRYNLRSLLADRRSSAILLSFVLAVFVAFGVYLIAKRGNKGVGVDRVAMRSAGRPAAELGGAGDARLDAAALYDARDVKPLSVPEAMAVNARITAVVSVGPGAKPFILNPAQASLRSSALKCLTAALYYEAASESDDGQRAVGQVIVNRMRHPAYPASVCGVVYQGSTRDTGCQFSFTCDGSLSRVPSASGWARSQRLADEALSGRVYAPVGHATHYHANYVVPYWAASLDKAATIGRHIFYRWKGRNGTAPAFLQRYAQVEQIPLAIASAVSPEEALPVPGAMIVEGEGSKDAQPASPYIAPATPIDKLVVPPTAVAEDKRVQPSILADQTAGTLKLPAAGANTMKSKSRLQDLDRLCSVTRKAAPVAPSSDTRVSRIDSISLAHCL